MNSRFRSTELCMHAIMGLSILALGLLFALQPEISQSAAPLPYYLSRIFSPLHGILTQFIVLYLCFVFVRIMWFIFTGAYRGVSPKRYLNKAFFIKERSEIVHEAIDALRILVPALITLITTSQIMYIFNVMNSSRLIDDTVLGWDKLITGTYPFIVWSSYDFPAWFIQAVIFSFNWLPTLLLILAFYLAAKRRELAYELTLAFSLTLLFTTPLYYAFPVLSPHDRYIDNVYHLPIAPDIAASMHAFKPVPAIRLFLSDTRESKAGFEGNYPTSTFPSSHVMWAVLFAVFAYRASKYTAIPLGGLAFLSSLGTFLLIQHYFVDALAGVLVAIVTLWIARKVAESDLQRKYGEKIELNE